MWRDLTGLEDGEALAAAPGDSVLGVITFEVLADSRIAKVQFAMSSGFAGDTGQWNVPAR
ncbi:hypothetical protein G3I77_34875 [Streptomyces sp. D2-8]|uniref:hypothetical protein n=1 Tax=Streptomyces sp. D2-8 TaxID=2707767 RepID=UPI0020BDA575|nr:hypothetical protein [Streptomyces sp. D2-8]MCK8438009.1 hypothetical protein [Streptomyces sp. D2-8]